MEKSSNFATDLTFGEQSEKWVKDIFCCNDGTIEVVVGGRDFNLYVLNGENGTLQWSYNAGHRIDWHANCHRIHNLPLSGIQR